MRGCIGSLIGTCLPTFVTIPLLGTAKTFYLFGLVLQGVLVGATGPDTLRLLTHLDVDDAGVARVLAAFQRVLAA